MYFLQGVELELILICGMSLFSQIKQNYRFQCKSVSDLEQKDLNGINKLFIPKSLSNWFNSGVSKNLVDKICQNNITTLYILFSSENYLSKKHYKEFEDLLISAAYSYEKSYKNDKELFYWVGSNSWKNPDNGRSFCALFHLDYIYKIESLKCASYLANCNNCEITMALPYTNSLMNFNYFVYKKINS